MPRASAEEKERSHERIVREASHLLRSRGLQNTSVSDVMSAAGLTHGGFYRHFKSKDELVAAALGFAIGEAMSELEAARTPGERARALKRYVDLYLSPEHVRSVRTGCPLAALSVDAGRSVGAFRKAADEGMQKVIALLARSIGDAANPEGDKARALLALLVGTVTLARVSASTESVDDLLIAARQSASSFLSA